MSADRAKSNNALLGIFVFTVVFVILKHKYHERTLIISKKKNIAYNFARIIFLYAYSRIKYIQINNAQCGISKNV